MGRIQHFWDWQGLERSAGAFIFFIFISEGTDLAHLADVGSVGSLLSPVSSMRAKAHGGQVHQ